MRCADADAVQSAWNAPQTRGWSLGWVVVGNWVVFWKVPAGGLDIYWCLYGMQFVED